MLAFLGLEWARGGAWPVLLLVLALLAAAWLGMRASDRRLRQAIHPAQWAARMAGNRPGVSRRQWWIGGLGLLLLVVSLL
ncbi:MAG: hypothetical protein KDB61_14515, partial [Planctomycetes bacterium]|nr:hypothetical protein [Planctomycetota bacterium]